MDRRLFEILSFGAPYAGLATLAYYLGAQVVTLSPKQIINFCFFIFQTLLVTPFLVLFIMKFKLHHQDVLRKINGYAHRNARLVVFTLSIVLGLTSYIMMFYQYFVKERSEAGMWSIQLNIFISILSYILYAKTLKLEILSLKFKYTVYIVMFVLLMIFLAHFSVMTTALIYLPELCLEIVIILLFLNLWWPKTPPFLLVLMIIADILSIQQFSRNLVMKSVSVGVLATRIILIILVAAHLFVNIYNLIKDLRSCARELYEEEGKDIPLSNIMISQIPLVEYKKQNFSQPAETEQNDKVPQKMQESMCDIIDKDCCAICTMKIQNNSLIYDIPCRHIFHNECLERWLKLRNSCPTCRKQAI